LPSPFRIPVDGRSNMLHPWFKSPVSSVMPPREVAKL